MKLHVLASGSSGNSYCVETDTDLIFVDIGVGIAKVKKYIDPLRSGKTVSLFITHEHIDHIRGIIPFMRAFSPRVYASAGTSDCLALEGISAEFLYPLAAGGYYEMDTFAVMPFNVSHDAAEPFGYKFMTLGGSVGFLTDLGYVAQEQLACMECVDILVLEANHDKGMLKNGVYPSYLKKRIASQKGHLSNTDAAAVLAAKHKAGNSSCLAEYAYGLPAFALHLPDSGAVFAEHPSRG